MATETDEFTKAFIAWMDALPAKAEAVGERLGVSAQTIRNWRASAIPGRKVDHVRRIMRDWCAVSPEDLGKIVLRPTPEQFDQWNDAALAAGKRIRDWAIEGLDELAAEQESIPRTGPVPLPAAAESEERSPAADLPRKPVSYPPGRKAN